MPCFVQIYDLHWMILGWYYSSDLVFFYVFLEWKYRSLAGSIDGQESKTRRGSDVDLDSGQVVDCLVRLVLKNLVRGPQFKVRRSRQLAESSVAQHLHRFQSVHGQKYSMLSFQDIY